jgi:hypothetical protein
VALYRSLTRNVEGEGEPFAEHIETEVRAELETLIDLYDYATYVWHKTRYGERPGHAIWYWTHKYVRKRGKDQNSFSVVVRLFESVYCRNDIQAAMWCTARDERLKVAYWEY